MTPRQAETLAFIKRHIEVRGHTPTHREIAEYLGVTPARVCHILDQLEERGRIRRKPGQHNGIVIPDPVLASVKGALALFDKGEISARETVEHMRTITIAAEAFGSPA